jgi:nucleotidyltransferase/DNA polymerase involved in DNA repair
VGVGITRLGHLQALDARAALRMLGVDGPALVRRARGEDDRRVDPARAAKSVSAETTFEADLARREDLERPLWRMAEKLARRLTEQDLAAAGLVLKLKTAGFALRTRSRRLARPTRLPDVLFAGAGRGGRPAGPRRAGAAEAEGGAGRDRHPAPPLRRRRDRAGTRAGGIERADRNRSA